MNKMITFVPIGGLCNRMRAIASGVFISKRVGAEINIIWKKNKDCFAGFTDLFQPITIEGVNVRYYCKMDFFLALNRKKNFYLPGFIRKFFFDTRIIGIHECEDEEIFRKISGEKVFIASSYSLTKHFSINELFIPVREVQIIIDGLKQDFNGYVVGIHIRRGDNTHSIEKNKIEDYFAAIDSEIKTNHEVKFYLATDSKEVRKEIIFRYGERILHNNALLERTSVQGMKDAVIDLWCLASTNKIIGSYYSSFSDIAAEMGGIELRII